MDWNIFLQVLGGMVGTVIFVFMTFATKSELARVEQGLAEHKNDIDKRLERIENKLDRLIENR